MIFVATKVAKSWPESFLHWFGGRCWPSGYFWAKRVTFDNFLPLGQDLWDPLSPPYKMTSKSRIMHETRRWSKFLLTSNLGRYLAEGIFYVRDALAHRPRHLLAQRKAFLDVFDHLAKKKTWSTFELQNAWYIQSINGILRFYIKASWPRLGQEPFCGTMVAKIEIFDAWLAMEKFFIMRNIILAKIEV